METKRNTAKRESCECLITTSFIAMRTTVKRNNHRDFLQCKHVLNLSSASLEARPRSMAIWRWMIFVLSIPFISKQRFSSMNDRMLVSLGLDSAVVQYPTIFLKMCLSFNGSVCETTSIYSYASMDCCPVHTRAISCLYPRVYDDLFQRLLRLQVVF